MTTTRNETILRGNELLDGDTGLLASSPSSSPNPYVVTNNTIWSRDSNTLPPLPNRYSHSTSRTSDHNRQQNSKLKRIGSPLRQAFTSPIYGNTKRLRYFGLTSLSPLSHQLSSHFQRIHPQQRSSTSTLFFPSHHLHSNSQNSFSQSPHTMDREQSQTQNALPNTSNDESFFLHNNYDGADDSVIVLDDESQQSSVLNDTYIQQHQERDTKHLDDLLEKVRALRFQLEKKKEDSLFRARLLQRDEDMRRIEEQMSKAPTSAAWIEYEERRDDEVARLLSLPEDLVVVAHDSPTTFQVTVCFSLSFCVFAFVSVCGCVCMW
eukprot:m.208307 g.208307  ORF g.208307 m.208307 type:complete len:321 (-) comp13764_c1_seq3:466-1428(-)